jgi:hypothetical protein
LVGQELLLNSLIFLVSLLVLLFVRRLFFGFIKRSSHDYALMLLRVLRLPSLFWAIVIGADPSFEPSVRYSAFTELGITLNITLRVLNSDSQFFIRHEFIKRLKKTYDREGIALIQPSAPPFRSA